MLASHYFMLSFSGMDEESFMPVVVHLCLNMMHETEYKFSIRVDVFKVSYRHLFIYLFIYLFAYKSMFYKDRQKLYDGSCHNLKACPWTYADSEGPDQPAHQSSLRGLLIFASGIIECYRKYQWKIRARMRLILFGFSDTSTLVGRFMSPPREREKRDRRDSRGDVREEQRRKRSGNESEETKETKTFPARSTLTCYKDSRPCPSVSQYQLDAPVT